MKKIISAIIIICIIIIGFITYKSMAKPTVKANAATLMNNSSGSNVQNNNSSVGDTSASNTSVANNTGNNSSSNTNTTTNAQSQSANASNSSNAESGQNSGSTNQESTTSNTQIKKISMSNTSNIQNEQNSSNNNFLSYYTIPNIYKSPGYIELTSDNLFGNYTLSKVIGGKNNGFCPTIYISSQLFASNGTNQSNPEYILAPIDINYLTNSEQIANYLGGENSQLIMLIAVPQNASKQTIYSYIKNAEQSPCNYPVLTKNGLVTFPNTNQMLIFKR